MMKLYHWEPNGACACVLITLAEKGLACERHYVDVLARRNHDRALTALNPTGELPILVDQDAPFHESSYICEYLEEAYPEPRLMPADPHGRWVVRGWQKFVDDHFAGAMSDLAWDARRPDVDIVQLAAGMSSAPTPERKQVWREHGEPFPRDRLARARDYARQAVNKMEAALANGPWLGGEDYGLADIAMFAWAGYLPWVAPDLVTPPIKDWLDRVGARDAVKTALKAGRTGDPFKIAAPGPEQTRWG